MVDKPCSPACERNRAPILAHLREHFADRQRVLEIGSGTGQHAVYFAAAMPWLTWQCTDRAANLAGIRRWLDEAALPNTPAPLALDVAAWPWRLPPVPQAPQAQSLRGAQAGSGRQQRGFDAAFSANTLHIMSWAEVDALFAGLGRTLASDAVLAVYGPFNYRGAFTSDSNAAFDASLKARDPVMGIRDFEAVDAQARAIGLHLLDDAAMPANNRLLVWRR